ncbi:hypothetical protein BGM19_00345 [Streptomyces agglomeratus]|nr:hypothetical protein BGM19_00345 [Streptomyces agglomeratus]
MTLRIQRSGNFELTETAVRDWVKQVEIDTGERKRADPRWPTTEQTAWSRSGRWAIGTAVHTCDGMRSLWSPILTAPWNVPSFSGELVQFLSVPEAW